MSMCLSCKKEKAIVPGLTWCETCIQEIYKAVSKLKPGVVCGELANHMVSVSRRLAILEQEETNGAI